MLCCHLATLSGETQRAAVESRQNEALSLFSFRVLTGAKGKTKEIPAKGAHAKNLVMKEGRGAWKGPARSAHSWE